MVTKEKLSLSLTDEETREAIRGYCDEQEIEMPEYLPALEYDCIAKAQLKKVVEYLQERWNGTEYEFYNIVAIPKEDWQSLLEEVK